MEREPTATATASPASGQVMNDCRTHSARPRSATRVYGEDFWNGKSIPTRPLPPQAAMAKFALVMRRADFLELPPVAGTFEPRSGPGSSSCAPHE
jgi:hypothetical protein